jgi:hypothetical protein
VPLPPDIDKLTFHLDVAEAIVVACEPAARSTKGVQKIQLLRDTVKVATQKQLTLLWDMWQQAVGEVC